VTPAETHRERGTGERGDFRQRGLHPREIVGMDAVEAGPADELRGSESQQPLDRLAGEEHRAVGSDERHRVGTVLDQCAEAFLTLTAGFFGADLLAAGPAQVERAQDGRAQPLQVMLDDVVRGAGLDVLRGRFLVEAAGDDDQGRVRRLEERDSQRVARAECRQGVIREDDVGRERAQRLPKGALRVHAPGGAADPGLAELPLDQRRVVGDVFHEEGANRRGHAVNPAARSGAASTALPRRRLGRRTRNPPV